MIAHNGQAARTAPENQRTPGCRFVKALKIPYRRMIVRVRSVPLQPKWDKKVQKSVVRTTLGCSDRVFTRSGRLHAGRAGEIRRPPARLAVCRESPPRAVVRVPDTAARPMRASALAHSGSAAYNSRRYSFMEKARVPKRPQQVPVKEIIYYQIYKNPMMYPQCSSRSKLNAYAVGRRNKA